MSDDDPESQLVRVEHGALALTNFADNRILSEMVGASLVLARDSAVVHVDLDALVREGKRLYMSGGKGMTEDNIRAFGLFLRAAEAGHSDARYYLGNCYIDGDGVTQDSAEAVKWYRKAAEQGHSDAQNCLGISYSRGRGVAQDYAEAVTWLRKAAEQGDAFGQNNLGYCYDKGQGVPQDYGKALKWYRKAAEQGNALGQTNLGCCYRDGHGVKVALPEAYAWIQLAASQRHRNAELEVKDLTAQISPSDLEAGERLYNEFKEKHSTKTTARL